MQSDALVFSSHKTATQTIRETLRTHGVTAVHAHASANLDLNVEDLAALLEAYHAYKKKPLVIISVFREPLSRMMSSFFQALQRHYFAWTCDINEDENRRLVGTAFDRSSAELNDLFERYMDRVDGFGESLDELAQARIIRPDLILFDPHNKKYGKNDLACATLYTFRFDQLMVDVTILARALGMAIPVWANANMTTQKAHYERYRQFKNDLIISTGRIERLYERRRHLIDRFYPSAFERMLREQIMAYSLRGTTP